MTKPYRCLVITLVLTTPLLALADPGERLVTVNGRAEVRVAPDEVVLELAVQTHDAALAQAKQQNDAIVTAALAAIDEVGAGAARVEADQMSIVPKHEPRSGSHAIAGYDVTTSITVTSSQVDGVAELLTAVLEAGVNTVKSVAFRSTEYRRHRDDALLMALEAAREKAELMAGGLGASVGRPVDIQEGSVIRRPPSPSNVSRTVSEVDSALHGPLAPGEVSIAARVTVSFELVD